MKILSTADKKRIGGDIVIELDLRKEDACDKI